MQCSCRIRAPLPAPVDQLNTLLACFGTGNAAGAAFASSPLAKVRGGAVPSGSARDGPGAAPAGPHSGVMKSRMQRVNARFSVGGPRAAPGASSTARRLPTARAGDLVGLRRGRRPQDGLGVCVAPRGINGDTTPDATGDATRAATNDAPADRHIPPPATLEGGSVRTDPCADGRRGPRRRAVPFRRGRGCSAGRVRPSRRRAWCSRGPGRRAAPRWSRPRRGPAASPRLRDPRRRG
jgi:hypothetical protein